ncbi:MAG: response regulator [Gammaproteobacteria bacterium]
MSEQRTIKTAVVVDDDEIEQYEISRLIRRHGMIENLLWFEDAELALEFLGRADRPEVDLFCVDISMPKMNGFEFIDAAAKISQQELQRAVVILLSVSTHDAHKKRASQMDSVDHFFKKPLTPDQLAYLTREVFDRATPDQAANA